MKRKKADSKYNRTGHERKPAHDNLCRQLVSGRWQRYGKRRQFRTDGNAGAAALPYRMRLHMITQRNSSAETGAPSRSMRPRMRPQT